MIKEAILKLSKKENLNYEEAEEVMNEIMSGKATAVQMSSYLTALSMKGETIEEITGSAAGCRGGKNGPGTVFPHPAVLHHGMRTACHVHLCRGRFSRGMGQPAALHRKRSRRAYISSGTRRLCGIHRPFPPDRRLAAEPDGRLPAGIRRLAAGGPRHGRCSGFSLARPLSCGIRLHGRGAFHHHTHSFQPCRNISGRHPR